ncbi:MAG TPA: cation-translocating P-type ATPase [Bacilli bacterium]|nr:cation-translocating P-type ATPase [Bacilli bacterium]HQD92514.1 cation-translocating P-type ATPase [Bacilli bacterium]
MKLTKKQRVIVSAILVFLSFILKELKLNIFKVEYYYYQDYGFVITLPNVIMVMSTVISGITIFKNAFNALRYKLVSIELLVSIAVIGAFIIGEYWEAAAVTFLFLLGAFLESITIDKTRKSIKDLLDSSPKIIRILDNGREKLLNPSDVKVGDIVIVKPGEQIGVDGIILEGKAYLNQASITGESMPVFKEENGTVYSGTFIESGYLIIKATKVGKDTTFSKILEVVEEAQDKKARVQRYIEKFSKYYTPGIIILAITFFIITRDLRLSLTLLVIACPGALVLSTPMAVVSAIGNGAKHGILVKGGETLELIGKAKVVAFDKTGTLTVGKPIVTKVRGIGVSTDEVLKISAILETYSEHPLAQAIIKKASEKLGKIDEVPTKTNLIIGKGIAGVYQNKHYLLGNYRLFTNLKIDYEIKEYIAQEESRGQTVILLQEEEQIIGVISLSDEIREESKQLIKSLKKMGIKKVVMLTGDNPLSANYLSQILGIDEYYAELMPDEKVDKLQELQRKYGLTIMVGDGINDAPALTLADIGIAIGGSGNDVSMEIADMVLMSDNIGKLTHGIGLSRKMIKIIKQNITFALVIAFGLLLGVIVQKVNLSLGMLIHELSVIIVLLNSLRLLRYRVDSITA